MKKAIKVVMLFLLINYSNAQETKTYEILKKSVWKMDIEKMRIALLLKMSTNEKMKSVPEEQQKIAINSVMVTLEKLRYHFYEDLTFNITINNESTTKGTYSIKTDSNELILSSEKDGDKVYKLISLEESKISLLRVKDNFVIMLVPEL